MWYTWGMKDVASNHHLLKRGNRWYFRRRVPTHLVDKAGTPVIQYSLDTSDKAEARRRARIEDLKADKWFDELEAGTAVAASDRSNLTAPRRVSLDELVEHARDLVDKEDQRRARRLLVDPPDDEDQRRDMLEDVGTERTIIQTPTHPDRQRLVETTAAKIADRAGIDLSEQPATLLAVAARALTELARRQEARLEQDHSTPSFDTMFAPRPAGSEPKVGGMSFRQLGDAYVKFKKTGKWADTTEGDMARVRVIVHRVIDADKPARLIDIEDVRKVRDAIATMPTGTIRPKKTKGAEATKPLSAATQEKYFRFFKSILKWGVDEGRLEAMPGAGIKLASAPKSAEPGRVPYSAAQLQTIFTSPLFTGCESATLTRRHLPGAKVIKDGWYWLPLVALYTGMRIGEVVQLLTSDVKTEGGITYFHIAKTEGDGKRLKTASSTRRIPVPQVLFDLGLGKVIDKHKTGRLFPEIPMPTGTHPSRTATQWWTRYGRAAGFHAPKTTFHSFRHCFVDALRDAEVPDFIAKVLTGHKDGSVHEGYGSGPSLATLKAAIDKVAFSAIDVAKLAAKN